MDLPPELHFAFFDFLDPIDSTCLGLTNKHFYAIHRRLHGTVSLTVRRDGPNDLEWAWHLAGNLVRKNPSVVMNSTDAAARGEGEEGAVPAAGARARVLPHVRRHEVPAAQAHPGMDGRGARVLLGQAEVRTRGARRVQVVLLYEQTGRRAQVWAALCEEDHG
jgi:hypothetical protein